MALLWKICCVLVALNVVHCLPVVDDSENTVDTAADGNAANNDLDEVAETEEITPVDEDDGENETSGEPKSEKLLDGVLGTTGNTVSTTSTTGAVPNLLQNLLGSGSSTSGSSSNEGVVQELLQDLLGSGSSTSSSSGSGGVVNNLLQDLLGSGTSTSSSSGSGGVVNNLLQDLLGSGTSTSGSSSGTSKLSQADQLKLIALLLKSQNPKPAESTTTATDTTTSSATPTTTTTTSSATPTTTTTSSASPTTTSSGSLDANGLLQAILIKFLSTIYTNERPNIVMPPPPEPFYHDMVHMGPHYPPFPPYGPFPFGDPHFC